MASLGYRVTLLDISEGMLRVARAKIGDHRLGRLITVRRGDMEKMDFPSKSFDHILGEGDAFGITPDPERALCGFAMVLRTNGTVSLNIINHYKMLPLAARRKKSFEDVMTYFSTPAFGRERDQVAMFRTWKPEQVLELIKESGLRVEMVAPRIVVADLLSEEIMATVKHNTKALGKLRNLGARLSEQPILAALGEHVLILAWKT